MTKLKLQCLTVDDERGAHLVLKNYISRMESLSHAGMCFDALEALNFLHNNPVDIIFLDINMPDISGLEMLKTLVNAPKVILVTAYSEFALESYEYGVKDYLVKPISFPRFLKAVNRIVDEMKSEVKQQIPLTEITETYFFVQAEGGQVRIDFNTVKYIKSVGNYVKIFTTTNNYLATMTTQDAEDRLPADQFIRIHRSYVVATAFISKFMGNQVFVGADALPIGTTFRQKVFDRLR